MGAVSGPSAAASFVTPVKSNSGTTHTSTVLTALHRENNPASLLSQRGGHRITRPPLANSAVNSFDSVHVGSHGNFSALELRSPFFLPSPKQGLPKFQLFVVFSNCLSFKVSATLKIAIFPYLRFQHFQIDMLESFL